MSDFLGRVGQIAEWAAVSNLTNRAVNAGCDKVGELWRHRKDNKHGSHGKSANVASTPQMPPQSQMPYSPSQPQQASYAQASPMPPPPSMGNGQLLISVQHIDGLNQSSPLMVILECNHQRYQTSLGQYQQQFTFPVYQFEYDQLFVWVQTEYQQQTIAHGEVPVRFLLNNTNTWSPQQQQQRWIPLRDQYNGPCGQLLVNIEYNANYAPSPYMPGPAPPPYSYY
ncbi:unnamed protein product [Adineta ricciae]|uniref:Uncharacterized protein n=1 Tax=Adineta ricciae TaxID=249248 RepID=A0A814DSF9_ADIRI|nr:unnamed protein product [Adineta ricciae]CAF0961095.1 unnamed protein product [Adineta ricciae]